MPGHVTTTCGPILPTRTTTRPARTVSAIHCTASIILEEKLRSRPRTKSTARDKPSSHPQVARAMDAKTPASPRDGQRQRLRDAKTKDIRANHRWATRRRQEHLGNRLCRHVSGWFQGGTLPSLGGGGCDRLRPPCEF